MLTPNTPPQYGLCTLPAEWEKFSSQLPGLKTRRLFSGTIALSRSTERLVIATLQAGMTPIISFKARLDTSAAQDWEGVAAGKYDTYLSANAQALSSLWEMHGTAGNKPLVTYSHEPVKDGVPAAWAAMQEYCMNFHRAYPGVEYGYIINGHIANKGAEELGQYITLAMATNTGWNGVDVYEDGPNRPEILTQKFQDFLTSLKSAAPIVIGEFGNLTADTYRATLAALGKMQGVHSMTYWCSQVDDTKPDFRVPLLDETALRETREYMAPEPTPDPDPTPEPEEDLKAVVAALQATIDELKTSSQELMNELLEANEALTQAQGALAQCQAAIAERDILLRERDILLREAENNREYDNALFRSLGERIAASN